MRRRPGSSIRPCLPRAPGQLFTATAYCKGTTTASGVVVRTGIAASDPALLPVGSVVNVTTGKTKYNGVYTIMDTGPRVQGRLLDLYMWSCHEALAFGRQQIELTVLRLGWNPNASTPSLIDRLFRRREAAAKTLPPPPPPRRANRRSMPCRWTMRKKRRPIRPPVVDAVEPAAAPVALGFRPGRRFVVSRNIDLPAAPGVL